MWENKLQNRIKSIRRVKLYYPLLEEPDAENNKKVVELLV